MKIQSPQRAFDYDLMATINQKDTPYGFGPDIQWPSYLPNKSLKASIPSMTPNPLMVHSHDPMTERKLRAQAFKERNNSLKFYIGLIQMDAIT